MKQYEDAFMELYNKFEVETPTSTKSNILSDYKHVLEKTGIKRRGMKRSAKVLLVAAIITTAALTAAAAYYSVSDAFRGILQVQENYDELTPTPPVLDSAGKLLGARTESSGVEVSLRAVVGDERSIKLLVDIVDPSGAPLAIRQADESLSTSDLQFDLIDLELLDGYQGDMSMSYGAETIDSDPTDNKTSMLINYEVNEAPLRGETYRLSLHDLMQFAVMDGTSFGMKPGDLYTILSQFGGHTQEDFERTGYSEDQDGAVTYSYQLMNDGDKSVPLCQATPGIRVTNAAVWQDSLYLRGTASSYDELQGIMTNAALINTATGAEKPWTGSGTSMSDDDGVTWEMSFAEVDSAEELKDYVWVCGYGEGLYPLIKGEWEFEFTLDYQDTTITRELGRQFRWEGFDLTVKRAEISPFTLYLDLAADAATSERMSPEQEWGTYRPRSDWEMSEHTVVLTMRDGSTITAQGPGGSHSKEEDTGVFQLTYVFDVVIIPEQVASIQIGELVVEL